MKKDVNILKTAKNFRRLDRKWRSIGQKNWNQIFKAAWNSESITGCPMQSIDHEHYLNCLVCSIITCLKLIRNTLFISLFTIKWRQGWVRFNTKMAGKCCLNIHKKKSKQKFWSDLNPLDTVDFFPSTHFEARQLMFQASLWKMA